MMKHRKIPLLALCLAAATLTLQACGQPTTESAKQAGPPEKVLKVVKAPKGGQIAEIVQRGDHQMVRVNGIPGPEYEDIAGVIFMVDGHHMAYEAKHDGKWLLVLDGKEWPLDAEVAHGSIQVSPDYRRLALLGYSESKWQTMVDGRPGPPFDFIWRETLQFSPDSAHVGYLALEGNKVAVVVDGKVQQRLEILNEGKEALSQILHEKPEEPKTGN